MIDHLVTALARIVPPNKTQIPYPKNITCTKHYCGKAKILDSIRRFQSPNDLHKEYGVINPMDYVNRCLLFDFASKLDTCKQVHMQVDKSTCMHP